MSLEEFNRMKIDPEPRDEGYREQLYVRLYLGLPKALRTSLRALIEESETKHIGGYDHVNTAVAALRLLGSEEQKTILANVDVREAIHIALDPIALGSAGRVSKRTEEIMDTAHEQVKEALKA
ncbi:MAG: hypothetical protein WC806_03725 [Candidatus Gracilibacteria bacterium]